MKTLILGLVAAASLAAALPAAAQPVDARQHRQDARIDQGVRSGELTRGETARLNRREVRLHRYEARARYQHDGYLTGHNRRVMRRMENRDSRAIYRLKHNDRTR